MTQLRMLKAKKASQKYNLKAFLRDNSISQSLSTRIQRHITSAQLAEANSVPIGKVVLLNYLTRSMLRELHTELVTPMLTVHPFFSNYVATRSADVGELCHDGIQQQRFAKDDVIFQRRKEATHMYFVVSGLLRYSWCRAGAGRVGRIVPLSRGRWL